MQTFIFSVARANPKVKCERVECLMWLAESLDWIYKLVTTNVEKADKAEKAVKGKTVESEEFKLFQQTVFELRREIVCGVMQVLAVIQLLDSTQLFNESIYDIAMDLQKLKDEQTGPQLLSFSSMVGCAFHYYEKAIGNKIVPVRKV